VRKGRAILYNRKEKKPTSTAEKKEISDCPGLSAGRRKSVFVWKGGNGFITLTEKKGIEAFLSARGGELEGVCVIREGVRWERWKSADGALTTSREGEQVFGPDGRKETFTCEGE